VHRSELCGVVVLFNPDLQVAQNIATYAASLERLYVVDNSDTPSAFAAERFPDNTVLLASGRNMGVAAALNAALARAGEEGYRWLLTMDQDGSFDPSELHRFLECAQTIPSEDLLLVSPVHSRKQQQKSGACRSEEVEMVMTSGNLVNVKNARAIGGYDARLFIDEVDHEFCLRGGAEGYRVISLPSVCVNHQLGKHYLRGGRQIRLYPPERLYYMMRNYLYVRQRYAHLYGTLFEKRGRFLRRFFYQHLRFSSSRFRCLLMLLKGWYDYKLNHFGPIND